MLSFFLLPFRWQGLWLRHHFTISWPVFMKAGRPCLYLADSKMSNDKLDSGLFHQVIQQVFLWNVLLPMQFLAGLLYIHIHVQHWWLYCLKFFFFRYKVYGSPLVPRRKNILSGGIHIIVWRPVDNLAAWCARMF